ncbi:MAG: GFA family protein [Hyphomonadaceae bacterium]
MQTSCPCGAVRLSIDAEPVSQFYCHCADCRRVHGACYTPEALYPAGAVTVEGETKSFTLRTTPRVFCAQCGTRLFAELPEAGLRGINGTLLPAFKADIHINCESAVAPVRDDLKHYRTSPKAFGGDGALADW